MTSEEKWQKELNALNGAKDKINKAIGEMKDKINLEIIKLKNGVGMYDDIHRSDTASRCSKHVDELFKFEFIKVLDEERNRNHDLEKEIKRLNSLLIELSAESVEQFHKIEKLEAEAKGIGNGRQPEKCY